MDDLKLTVEFDFVEPEELFDTWLDGDGHAAMTGGAATGDGAIGSTYTAWDGYIWGTTLELDRPRRIVQSWRTAEFDDEDDDSHIEIVLAPIEGGGTLLTLVHTDIPDGEGERYLTGWNEHYFEPMLNYFEIDDDA